MITDGKNSKSNSGDNQPLQRLRLTAGRNGRLQVMQEFQQIMTNSLPVMRHKLIIIRVTLKADLTGNSLECILMKVSQPPIQSIEKGSNE